MSSMTIRLIIPVTMSSENGGRKMESWSLMLTAT